jgi:hypothetical protein
MKNLITKEYKERIDKICFDYEINNYTINQDGSIDVKGSVYLLAKQITQIPLRFNKVSGYFNCSTNKLSSLKGCPNEVGGSFTCSYNRELTTLEYCPEIVGGELACDNCSITSLEGCTKEVGRSFLCYNNMLTSLEYAPTTIGSGLQWFGNKFSLHVLDILKPLPLDEQITFLKYQAYYDIWTPNFNKTNAMVFIDEIRDGLR